MARKEELNAQDESIAWDVDALKMAMQTRKKKSELIYSSDRGVQYCT